MEKSGRRRELLNPGGQVPGWMLDAVTALYSSPFEKQLGFGGLHAC